MSMTEASRGMEGPLEEITPGGLQGPGLRTRAAKGGQRENGHCNHRHAAQDSRGQEGLGNQFEDVKGSTCRDNQ